MTECTGLCFAEGEIWVADRVEAEPASASRCSRLAAPFLARYEVVDGAGSLPVEIRASSSFSRSDLQWFADCLARLKPWRDRLENPACPISVAVPSTMRSSLRQDCRGIALRAGWEQLRFVSLDLAQVAGELPMSDESLEVLALHAGNERTELSLLHAFKGAARVQQRLAVLPCSQLSADSLLLQEICRRLAWNPFRSEDWLAIWSDVRHLSREMRDSTIAAIEVTAPPWPVRAVVSASRLDLWTGLQPDVEFVLDTAQEMLRQNHGSADTGLAVLLSGSGPLCWPQGLARIEEALGTPARLVGLDRIADGAALLSLQNTETGGEPLFEAFPAWFEAWQSSRPSRNMQLPWSALNVELLDGCAPAIDGDQIPQKADDEDAEFHLYSNALFDFLRKVASSNPGLARGFAQSIVSNAQHLKDDLPEGDASKSPIARANLLAARQRISEGFRAEAVHLAHAAFGAALNDPEVFGEMVEIHISAAAAEPNDKTAIEWLECAHTHDQSNRVVHECLAARYMRHATHLASQAEFHAAIAAVDRSLAFRPLDAAAASLAKKLRQSAIE